MMRGRGSWLRILSFDFVCLDIKLSLIFVFTRYFHCLYRVDLKFFKTLTYN